MSRLDLVLADLDNSAIRYGLSLSFGSTLGLSFCLSVLLAFCLFLFLGSFGQAAFDFSLTLFPDLCLLLLVCIVADCVLEVEEALAGSYNLKCWRIGPN